VFNDLVGALAEVDPDRLESILTDPSHELILAIASHQKVLGEALVALDETPSDTSEQIGWLLIALSEISTCWWNHT
jgi:hypothetical protein